MPLEEIDQVRAIKANQEQSPPGRPTRSTGYFLNPCGPPHSDQECLGRSLHGALPHTPLRGSPFVCRLFVDIVMVSRGEKRAGCPTQNRVYKALTR